MLALYTVMGWLQSACCHQKCREDRGIVEKMNEKLYFSPTEFEGSNTAAIQAAVDEAQRTNVRTVLIPARKDGSAWKLDAAIRVPGDMTVILNGCTIETKGNAFVNCGMSTRALAGEEQKIFLLGRHGARIVGVETDAPQILLGNVRDCRVAGITFVAGGGLKLDFVRYSKVQMLRFEGSKHGVVFTEGCNNIILENVDAATKEEAVLLRSGRSDYFGRGRDIYTNILCRIRAVTDGAPAIGLYAGYEELYNVVVRDVTDLTQAGDASVRIGDVEDAGKIRDITVRGVDSRRSCVETGCTCADMFYSNLRAGEGCDALSCAAKNIRELLDGERMEIVLPQFCVDVDRAFLTPNAQEFWAQGDAQTIQNAVDAASARGINCVVIPRWNVRTQSAAWHMEKAVKVPSCMTIVFLNSYLRQVDFVYENMFTNSRAYEHEGRCLAHEEHDLTFTGIGDAVLDGGEPNGLLEKTCFLNGLPDKRYNATVLFNNVRNLVLENLQIRQSRWYGTYFIHCDTVRISNIDFDNFETCCNRDGVDVRQGCHNFLVENITGTTGDDTIAFNNLGNDGNDGRYVEGKDENTLNVVIRNVKADASRWFTVRLLVQDRHLEQNFVLDTVMDSSSTENKKQVKTTVMIGSHEYHYKVPAELGDLAHITVRDVYSRAARGGVSFGGHSDDVRVSNVHCFDVSQAAVTVSKQAGIRDVYINGVFHDRNRVRLDLDTLDSGETGMPAEVAVKVLQLPKLNSENFVVENVFASWATTGVELSGGGNVEVRNLHIDELKGQLAKVDAISALTINGNPVK